MNTTMLVYICMTIGLTSALVAGTFLAFSDFLMRAFKQCQPQAGIEAMQQLNLTVFRSVFLTAMLGLVPVTLLFCGYVYIYRPSGTASVWILTGTIVYVVFTFAVTAFGNVPMNRQLAAMDNTSPDTARYWQIYTSGWTRWNHVRTCASFVTAICFVQAAIALARS